MTRLMAGVHGDGLEPGDVASFTSESLGMPIQGSAHFGEVLAVGRLDGDPSDALAIGEPVRNFATSDEGMVYLMTGGAAGLSASRRQQIVARTGLGSAPAREGDNFGAALAIADFDGDGHGDLAIGVPGRAIVDEKRRALLAEAQHVDRVQIAALASAREGTRHHARQLRQLAQVGEGGQPICIADRELPRDAAAMLWRHTDLTPADVDVAQVYDGFSFMALAWLEALGFCGPGEGGPFIEGGRRIARTGDLPINTGGGQLSAGRLHGFGHVHEAVRQLRGEAGDRQVPGAPEVAVVGNGGPNAGCLLLTRG